MMAVPRLPSFVADLSQAERFLTWLDEDAEWFTFQLFDDLRGRKDGRMAQILHGDLDTHADFLTRGNAAGAGVFVTVNATDGHGRKLGNIVRIRAVWAECDRGLPAQWPLEPHAVIESSPGKFHVYWRVDGLSREDFAGVMARLVQDWGSDPNAKDLARVLRLPGFWHLKDPARPFQVRIDALDESLPYPAEVVLQAFPPLATPQPAASGPIPLAPASAHRALVMELASRAAKRTHEDPMLGRHAMVLWLGRECAHRGLPVEVCDQALEVFADLMRPCDTSGVIGGLNLAQEQRAFRDAHARGLADPPEKRWNAMPRPGPVEPVVAGFEAAEATPGGRPKLRVVGGTEHDDRPLIQMRAGELPEIVDAAERNLIAAGVEVFQHGTRLVRVGQWQDAPGPVQRPLGSAVLHDLSAEWLADSLTRTIRFERWDARKEDFKRVDCPTKVATTLLARAGQWAFPRMIGFTDSPTLDLQGRVIMAPGYDVGSGLYLSHPPALEAIAETVRPDAERAGEILAEAVRTFPFVTDHDLSACMALIMTALFRRVLPSAPIGCVSANTPGTGKSKLVDVISAIATGRPAAVAALGVTPEELEKRVDSVLLKGDQVCSFDNVDRPVKSDVLCQVATQPMKSIRVMGLSKIVEAPTNVLMLMTGNNLTLVGDLVRRCVVVNLDAGCERPELREFDRDAVDYVLERRAELIRAALVISKAYLDAGCPRVNAPPYGSFEHWDRMVRRALIWAGYPDPLTPAEGMREQDHELVGMRDFLREWSLAAPSPVTAAELSDLIRKRMPLSEHHMDFKYPALYDAAIQVMGDANRWGPRELGYRLRSMHGRLFDGRRIAKVGSNKAGVRWQVEAV